MLIRVMNQNMADETAYISVSHEREEIRFKFKSTDRSPDTHDIFRELNHYWNYLANNGRNMSDIFNIYKEARETLDTFLSMEYLNEKLTECAARLYEYHKLEELDYWIGVHSDIIISGEFNTTKSSFKNYFICSDSQLTGVVPERCLES